MSKNPEHYRQPTADYSRLQELENAFSAWEQVTRSTDATPEQIARCEKKMMRARRDLHARLRLLTYALVLANPKCECGASAICFNVVRGKEFDPRFSCDAHCTHVQEGLKCDPLDIPPDHYGKLPE